MTVPVRTAARTDVGRARERNEDSYFTGASIFAVADGLGGHRAGDVASKASLEPLTDLATQPPAIGVRDLAAAVRRGNVVVFERAQGDSSLQGMGTTLTAVAINDGMARVAHVGDSRCYLVRSDEIRQVTEDHTVVARMVKEGRLTPQEAETHPQRSLVLRALGSEENVAVDEVDLELRPGDRILLCSDGLTGPVSDEEILAEVASSSDLDGICRRLVDLANARGGPDNITVVLVEYAPGDSPETPAAVAQPAVAQPAVAKPAVAKLEAQPAPAPRRWRPPVRALVWSLVVLATLISGWLALRTAANRSYYVGVEAGRVAVFRGFPNLPLPGLSHVEERTPLLVAEVAPYRKRALADGIRVDSLAEARRIIFMIADERQTPPVASPSAVPSPIATGSGGEG